ncbi:T9SS type A sorting domain-containing protein [Chryseobacterium cucumeris]|uniref:T9SS type A sorting domain-containing protein n=1 Tax=Chryseobacterium cucumeris TaxID=1813611 RepID=UPI0023F4F3C1|nr:T9SS type A sorting domain-containing protein [Chryseobacterium cucumeris]
MRKKIRLDAVSLATGLYIDPNCSFIKIGGWNGCHFYKIFNRFGKVVQQGFNIGDEINIESLVTGAYVICLYNAKQESNFKFIKD